METLYWYCRRLYLGEPPVDPDAAKERARRLRENVKSDDHQMPIDKLLQGLDTSADKVSLLQAKAAGFGPVCGIKKGMGF